MENYKGFLIERFEVESTTKKFNYKCGSFRAPRKMDVMAQIDRAVISVLELGGEQEAHIVNRAKGIIDLVEDLDRENLELAEWKRKVKFYWRLSNSPEVKEKFEEMLNDD